MTEKVALLVIPSEAKEFAFHFKIEKIRNSKNEVIGEGKKLPSVKISVARPTAEGILAIVTAGGKELELLLDAATDVVVDRVRSLINEVRAKLPDGQEIKPDMISMADAHWSIIANIPKAVRKGLGIADEDWEDFAVDYRAIMPTATNKDIDRIEKHVKLFKSKFAQCRNDKKALGVLDSMLDVWAANTGSMEDNQTVYEYLKGRVTSLLQEEEKVLAEAL